MKFMYKQTMFAFACLQTRPRLDLTRIYSLHLERFSGIKNAKVAGAELRKSKPTTGFSNYGIVWHSMEQYAILFHK